MATNNELISLSKVVDEIRSASDRELIKLGEISDKLSGFSERNSNLHTNNAQQRILTVDSAAITNAIKQGFETSNGSQSQLAPPAVRATQRNRKKIQRANKSERQEEVELFLSPTPKVAIDDAFNMPIDDHKIGPGVRAESTGIGEVISPIADQQLQAEESQKHIQEKAPEILVEIASQKADKTSIVDNPLEDMPDKVEAAIKEAMADFEGYYRDSKGRLHRQDGSFASKQEQEGYASAQETAKQRAAEQQADGEEKQTNIFAQIGSTLKDLAQGAAGTFEEQNANDATDAAGVAAGGSFFYAAKDLYQFGQETTESLHDAKDKLSAAKESAKEKKEKLAGTKFGQWIGLKQSPESNGEQEGGDVDTSPATETTQDPNDQLHEANGTTKAIADEHKKNRNHGITSTQGNENQEQGESTGYVNKTSPKANISQLISHAVNSIGEQELRGVATTDVNSQPKSTNQQPKLTSNQEKSTSTPQKLTDTIKNGAVTLPSIAQSPISNTSISNSKSQQYQANHLEVLRENGAAQEQQNESILDKLDDMITAIKNSAANAGGGGGLLDLAGEFLDFGGEGKKGKKSGLHDGSNKPGSNLSNLPDSPNRLSTTPNAPDLPNNTANSSTGGRFKSALSAASETTKGAGSKAVSMAGTAFQGISKAAPMVGRALPILAPALMAYEAVSAFTDTSKQQEVFNLKEGEEATTGQKSSMALASVLDMGGLVSGAAGLIGGGLGALGFEGAAEAMSFDSGDMARGIYDLFGGNSEDETKTAESTTQKPPAQRDTNADDSQYFDNAEKFMSAETTLSATNNSQLRDEAKSVIQEMDMANTTKPTTDEAKAYASANGIEYAAAYNKLSEDKAKQQQERDQVAKEMGIDTSGMIEHDEYGQLYSPQKKADQVALVDQEIARRKEDEKKKENKQANQEKVDEAKAESIENIETIEEADISVSNSTNSTSVAGGGYGMAQPHSIAKQEPVIHRNEKVSELAAQQSAAQSALTGAPSTVSLDKASLDAIKQAANNTSSSTTHTTNTVNNTSEPTSAAKTTGEIPNNFTDRSLQRQSADLE